MTLIALGLLAVRLQPAAAQAATPVRHAAVAAASDTTPVAQQGESRSFLLHPRLFQRRDAYLAAGFGLATVAFFPFDQQVAKALQSPAMQSNAGFNGAATGFEKASSPGAFYIGGGLYLAGRLGGSHRLADLGLHATESVLLAEGMGFVLKRAFGRARPYMSDAADPRDFSFGTGFGTGDRRSLPSGHTYTAFALASAVTSEIREWSPRSTWLVAPLMYGGATMVGLSRMYHNQHWASDIVLGAAVGTFSGLKLVRFMHANPDNRVNRLLLGAPLLQRDRSVTRLGWQIEF